MRTPPIRFSIRGLMAAVAIAACLLALPGGLQAFAAVLAGLSIPFLAIRTAWRFEQAGHRLPAAIIFWGLAVPVNVLFAALCASPGILSAILFLISLFIVMPTLAGFGAAWAVLEGRRGEDSPLVCRLAPTWVIVLALMPGVTAWTEWPFRLRFLAARSALERVADQTEAGQAVSFPQNAGTFRLVASRVDPRSRGVALLIDPDPNGPSGFVRHHGSLTGPYACFRPIRGDRGHLGLGGGWCYHEED